MESRQSHVSEHDSPSTEKHFGQVSLTVLILLFVGAFVLGSGCFLVWHWATGGTFGSGTAQEQGTDESEQAESSSGEQSRIDALIADMTLEQKVCQLFVVSPETITGVETQTAAGDATREAIGVYPVGGLCFREENFVDKKQTTEMLRNMQNYTKDACGMPLFTCVAEEGGSTSPVASSSAFSLKQTDSAADLGKDEDVEAAREAARTIGGYLADLGFNLTFAPVADIYDSSLDTKVSERLAEQSFGSDAKLVASMVEAQVDGFSRGGVFCAVKHFPGIGAAEEDSHNEMLYSHKSLEDLKSLELVPFEAAVKAKAPLIMVGNITCVEAARSDGSLPASMSPTLVNGLLRETMGYNGVVITDSMATGSVGDVCKASDQGVKALQAGVDLIFEPTDFKEAYKGVLDAVKDGTISEERIDESLRRIVRLKLTI